MTTLTVVMIAGLVTVITLLVIRLSDDGVTIPDQLTLPDGVTADAVTFGTNWTAVVDGNQILIFDSATGTLRKTVLID